MKLFPLLFVSFLMILFTGCVCRGDPDPVLRKANSTILPGDSIQVDNKVIPLANAYRRMPGCYIACYDNNNHALKGLVRVNGLYLDKNCQPQGYFFKDLAVIPYFKKVCNEQLPNCKGRCVADGNTGRFLGIAA